MFSATNNLLSYSEFLNEKQNSKIPQDIKIVLMTCLNTYFIEILIQNKEIEIEIFVRMRNKVFKKFENVISADRIDISKVMNYIKMCFQES